MVSSFGSKWHILGSNLGKIFLYNIIVCMLSPKFSHGYLLRRRSVYLMHKRMPYSYLKYPYMHNLFGSLHACNPIMVKSYGFLINYMVVGKASDSMTNLTSIFNR